MVRWCILLCAFIYALIYGCVFPPWNKKYLATLATSSYSCLEFWVCPTILTSFLRIPSSRLAVLAFFLWILSLHFAVLTLFSCKLSLHLTFLLLLLFVCFHKLKMKKAIVNLSQIRFFPPQNCKRISYNSDFSSLYCDEKKSKLCD